MSSVHIHKINGKSFVSGLTWEVLYRPLGYMKEAREIGRREGMDIVAIRRKTIIQAGFVAKDQGVSNRMYSLAAVLADALDETWVGVFKLDEVNYAFVAVEEGAIRPECDVVGTREQILEKLVSIYSSSELQNKKMYLPADFNFGGKEVSLESLLVRGKVKREHRLRYLTLGLSRREWGVVALGLLGIGAAGAGWMAWQEGERARERDVAIRRQQALAELRARSEQNISLTALHHPWAEQPSTPTFLSTCGAALGALPLYVGGWVLDTAKCEATGWQAIYERRLPVTVNDFLADARRHFHTSPQWDAGANKATITQALTMKAGGDETLLPMDERLRSFVSAMQTLDIKYTLTATPLPAIPNEASVPIGVVPFAAMSFSLNSDWDMPTVFQAMPVTGLRVKSLEVTLNEQAATLHWSARGEVYGK